LTQVQCLRLAGRRLFGLPFRQHPPTKEEQPMSAAKSKPAPASPQTEREVTRERIERVASWLIGGALRPEAVKEAMAQWHVSRRTGQVYVKKAAERIARMSEYKDPLFALKLSQVQRDRLFQEVQALLRSSEMPTPQYLRTVLQAVQAELKILDSRDRTAAKIAQLEGRCGKRSAQPQAAEPANLGALTQPRAPVGAHAQPSAPTEPETLGALTQPRSPVGAHAQPSAPVEKAQPVNRIRETMPHRNGKGSKELATPIEPQAAASPGVANCALETSPVAQSA
jgi:hypothetical protein